MTQPPLSNANAPAIKLTIDEQFQIEFQKNPLYWGMNYLKEHFRDESPPFHLKIMIESLKHYFFACASPRQSAKSTILNLLPNVHDVCFKNSRFILLLQNTEEKAQESLHSVKMEIKNNPMIKQYQVEITRDTKDDTVFRHTDGFETRILCKGKDQLGGVRGAKFGAYRPDRIRVDDLEDDKSVKNPMLRAELQDMFDQVIIPAGQQDICRYTYIGTIFHDDSLMAKLVSRHHYPEWRKLLFKALNKRTDGTLFSLWPQVWNVEKLLDMQKKKPTVFAMEYQNDPVSGLLSKFEKEDWRYWYIEEGHAVLLDAESHVISKYKLSDCRAAIACDLAWEDKRRSDSSVIMPGLLTPNSEILIDTYVCERGMRPAQLEEYVFNMEEKYRKLTKKAVPIGFEKAKLEKVMKFMLREAMKRRNVWLMFKDLIWATDKSERIITPLQPRYKQHSIFHRTGMGDLEHQLLRVPSGAHDDLADAAQSLTQLLRFTPTKSKVKEAKDEDPFFDWLRKRHIEKYHPNKSFVFGKKKVQSGIPAIETWR